MIVVADTSPLLYLILIEHEPVLPALYGRVIAPRVDQMSFHCIGKHAQCAEDAQVLAHRLVAATLVVDQQSVGLQLLCECDGFQFAAPECSSTNGCCRATTNKKTGARQRVFAAPRGE